MCVWWQVCVGSSVHACGSRGGVGLRSWQWGRCVPFTYFHRYHCHFMSQRHHHLLAIHTQHVHIYTPLHHMPDHLRRFTPYMTSYSLCNHHHAIKHHHHHHAIMSYHRYLYHHHATCEHLHRHHTIIITRIMFYRYHSSITLRYHIDRDHTAHATYAIHDAHYAFTGARHGESARGMRRRRKTQQWFARPARYKKRSS